MSEILFQKSNDLKVMLQITLNIEMIFHYMLFLNNSFPNPLDFKKINLQNNT